VFAVNVVFVSGIVVEQVPLQLKGGETWIQYSHAGDGTTKDQVQLVDDVLKKSIISDGLSLAATSTTALSTQ